MKKNYLKSYPTKKTTKKTTKKVAKKPTKKRANKTLSRDDKITRILSKVSEICNYAIDNLCTEQAQFEELELLLNEYVK